MKLELIQERQILKPGQFSIHKVDPNYLDYYNGNKFILEVCCPKCGKSMNVGVKNHKVIVNKDNWTVTLQPSLVCAFNCGWHVWIRDNMIIEA